MGMEGADWSGGGMAQALYLVPKFCLGTPSPKLRFASIIRLMTPTRPHILENNYPYFSTFAMVGWLAVFTRPEAVPIIFDSGNFLKTERAFRLYGYVIPENHLHLIASAPKLSHLIKSFRMCTARPMIDLLEAPGARVLWKGVSYGTCVSHGHLAQPF